MDKQDRRKERKASTDRKTPTLVSVVFSNVEPCATDRSPIQRGPRDCGVSLCVI